MLNDNFLDIHIALTEYENQYLTHLRVLTRRVVTYHIRKSKKMEKAIVIIEKSNQLDNRCCERKK